MGTLATLVVKLTADASDFDKGLKQAQGMGQSFLSGMQGLGRAALAGAAGAVTATVGAVGAVVSQTLPLASDFQGQLTTLGIAAKESGLSFDQLHDAALAVGGDTSLLGVSATGAADSMTGLYKAGLNSAVIFGDLQGYMAGTADLGGALRASIDMAAATSLDMVQASDLAAVALSTFGAEMETDAEKAQFINDALNNMVQAADASVAEVDDLAMGLKNVGPTAAAMGISIFDVNNALAILSTRGIQGAEAGTALKSMLANMRRPTNDVQEALSDLNVSLYDAEGVFVGLPSLVEQMQGAFAGLTQEQRDQYAQTLAGTFGMNALNTLLAEGVEGWSAMADATAGAAGIQEQAAAQANTLRGMKEALWGTIETLAIGIGETFLPIGERLIGWLSDVADRYGPKVVAFFQTAGDIVGAFLSGAPGDFPWEDIFPPGIADVVYGIATGFETFIAALQAGEGPVQAVIGALGAAGYEGIATGLSQVVAGVQGLIAAVAPYVAMAMEWISQNVQVEDVLMAIGIAIASVVIPALASIIASVAPVVAVFVAIVAAVAAVRTAWETDFLGIRTALENAWARIQPALTQLIAWLQIYIPVALETLAGIWQNVLMPALEVVIGFITDSVLPLWGAVAEVLSAVVGKALEALAGLWQNVLWPALKNMAAFIFEELGPVFEWFVNNVLAPAQRFFKAIGEAIQGVIGYLRDLAGQIRGLDLPDWLTPGSPTPLEIGLLGIADAARQVARMSIPALAMSLAAPAGVGGAVPAAAAAPAGGGLSGGLTINIYGARDAEDSADAVIRALRDRGMLPQVTTR
jgi:TP901 family phage tail tape measure protein